MQLTQSAIAISTSDGEMPAVVYAPIGLQHRPGVLLLMEAFGLTPYLQQVAARIATEGYVVLVPDLYYRESLPTTFGYDEVDKAMATMYRLDFGQPMKTDLHAALMALKAHPKVNPEQIGVTGFCLGGGLSFLMACEFSQDIAAVAPFYGVVLDEWIEAMPKIAVPVYLFFGGVDPFISGDRIQQIESRLQELGKDYRLKVYPEADHGFFCHERSSYHPLSADDAWHELTQFFRQQLQRGDR